ncbi:MAG: hypothetical protein H0T78_04095 [Longispora sp.]|nr:hypothetical protein [Longispora sp. (in: high G+C Gram-positive bacteria)]
MASAGGSSWVDGERENFHRTVRALPVTHGPTELPTSPTNPQVTASLHHFAESLGLSAGLLAKTRTKKINALRTKETEIAYFTEPFRAMV